jgi:hypothetical protein
VLQGALRRTRPSRGAPTWRRKLSLWVQHLLHIAISSRSRFPPFRASTLNTAPRMVAPDWDRRSIANCAIIRGHRDWAAKRTDGVSGLTEPVTGKSRGGRRTSWAPLMQIVGRAQ